MSDDTATKSFFLVSEITTSLPLLLLLPSVIFSASLTRNVFSPADDDDQLPVRKVTEGGERALGRVGLQRVWHGE